MPNNDDLIARLRLMAVANSANGMDASASLADEAADALEAKDAALRGILNLYVGLVNCGDCGFWDPETEDDVIRARQALAPQQERIET